MLRLLPARNSGSKGNIQRLAALFIVARKTTSLGSACRTRPPAQNLESKVNPLARFFFGRTGGLCWLLKSASCFVSLSTSLLYASVPGFNLPSATV